MALAKFSEWVFNEMGEPLANPQDQAGANEPSLPEVEQHVNLFKTQFENLMKKIDSVKSITNKPAVRQMLTQLVGHIVEKVNLTGAEKATAARFLASVEKNI